MFIYIYIYMYIYVCVNMCDTYMDHPDTTTRF